MMRPEAKSTLGLTTYTILKVAAAGAIRYTWGPGEALKNKLIEVVAPNEQNLLAQLDGREIVRFDGKHQVLRLSRPRVIHYAPSIRERILTSISDPNIAFILLVLGALGIYVEYSSPGLIFPGVAGAILVLLALTALAVLPINWVGVALLVLSFALFVLELKFASHGILGAGGVASMILGALLLVQGPPAVRIRLSTAISVALPFAIISMFLVSMVIRARAQKVMTGPAGMENAIGVALTELSPKGRVFVHGEYWNAVSATPVAAGATIRVIRVRDLTLEVEPAAIAS
jgi:membrane-bound serine protease (ClpP class)